MNASAQTRINEQKLDESLTLLKVDAISVARGEVDVLRDVSFSVKTGELVAILGANGAGKTTLLRALSGLLMPHAGTVHFGGNKISTALPHQIARYGLIHVPEGRGILSELTVRENLALGMVLHGWHGRDLELKRIYDLFPILKERASGYAGMLSGGEQQMLTIARSLLCRPRLLMVDELSLGLAPKITLELMALLKKISRSGPTVIVVEQNAQLALQFADQIYVLSQGRMILSGTPKELRRDPKLLAAYLGQA